jgi:hypothetical protein
MKFGKTTGGVVEERDHETPEIHDITEERTQGQQYRD